MTFVTFVTNVTKKNSPQKMKILVACEYSGTTRDAFTALGLTVTEQLQTAKNSKQTAVVPITPNEQQTQTNHIKKSKTA